MNRIVERFARLKREGKKGFVAYIGAGDPNLETTRQLALTFDKAGVDVLELGVQSGPRVGALLRQVRAWWLSGGCIADAAACRRELARLARG